MAISLAIMQPSLEHDCAYSQAVPVCRDLVKPESTRSPHALHVQMLRACRRLCQMRQMAQAGAAARASTSAQTCCPSCPAPGCCGLFSAAPVPLQVSC